MVFYRGRAEHQQQFVDYYRTRHVPVLRQLPGVQDIVLRVPVDCSDPATVVPGDFFLIAEFTFRSESDLLLALRSEPRENARSDFFNFPTFHGEVFHQAMMIEKC